MLTVELARRQKQLSLNDLSATTRIAAHFLSLVENGRGIPTADQLERLAAHLGVPPETLLLPVPDLAGAKRG
jgi:transcriptional regulator with XRE-family HTH domain